MSKRFIIVVFGAIFLVVIGLAWRNQAPTQIQKRQDFVRMYVEGANVPIAYYGKVVDQNEQPISGVAVRYSIQSMYVAPVLPGARSNFHDVYTDASGLFSILGEKGASLGFESLTKAGYKYSQKGSRGQLYSGEGDSNYKPQPNNPEIFTLVHKGDSEPLTHYNAHLAIPCDGTTVRVNAMNGKLAPDGDLQITLKREPYNIVFGGPRFSWSVRIGVNGGGLVELVGAGTYRAPEQGYAPEYVQEVAENARDWGTGLRKEFYIKTSDNHYGRISIDLIVAYQPPPARAGLEAYINPKDGSRNLEYDTSALSR